MHRVVLLGASNLSLSFPVVVNLLRSGLNGPLDICAAEGHGRSYGIWSSVGPRALPGIRDSKLWDRLSGDPDFPGRQRALITDIGNDLMFNIPPQQIVAWVRECSERLLAVNADLLLTMLPLGSVAQLSAARYYLFRTLLFAANRHSFETMRNLVEELDGRLRELAEELPIRTVEPETDWYGFDPIHIRGRLRMAAWTRYLSEWPDWEPSATVTPVLSSLESSRLKPHDRRWFWRPQRFAQPTWKGHEVRISLY